MKDIPVGVSFFYRMTRPLFLLFFLLPLLIFSCSNGGDDSAGSNEPVEECMSQDLLLSDSLVADSIIKDTTNIIAADSFRFVIEFFDATGVAMSHPVEIQIEDNFFPDSRMTDAHGKLTYIAHKDHLIYVVYSNDTLVTYMNERGGEERTEHIQLNVRPMYGRIMDNDGTPLVGMPVHMHFRGNKKDRASSCGSDAFFRTDSAGYYHTYVPTNFHSIVLRSCGFVFGVIPRREFESYPKQNFLFTPFEVENRCAYNVPSHEFFIDVPVDDGFDKRTVSATDWPALFALDPMLEAAESVTVRTVFPQRAYTYRIKKRNGAFSVPRMRVCLR